VRPSPHLELCKGELLQFSRELKRRDVGGGRGGIFISGGGGKRLVMERARVDR